MSAKELVMKAPELCGVPNAARWARIAEFVWVEEATHPKSVFARTEEDGQDESGRLAPLFGWTSDAPDSGKAMYIMLLLALLLVRHYILEHGRSDLMSRAALIEGFISPSEAKYSDVSALLTVEQAAKGFWT
jgi:hypothetical protein